MKKLIILGMNGYCFDILDLVEAINARAGRTIYECAGYLDDDASKFGKAFDGGIVHGPITFAPQFTDCVFANAIGSAKNFFRKEQILARTGIPDERFETLIHPSAVVSPRAHIGHGVIIFQGVSIASGVRVGKHTTILSGGIFGHDDEIGDYGSIAAGVAVAGRTTIGKSCYLGTNCTIIGDIKIGDYAMVGMASAVFRDVEANVTVTGNPARVTAKREP
jgi:sugar O-acyltransferase (sialic acid O-acetyltransferase NeuD family)